MGEMKPSRVQPSPTMPAAPPTPRPAAEGTRYAQGQREARVELRKAMLSVAATCEEGEVLDGVLNAISAWMFSGEYAITDD